MSSPDNTALIAVIINDQPVVISLAAAVAEWFKLDDTFPLTTEQGQVFAALTLALGSMPTGDGAQKLYEALNARNPPHGQIL